MKELIRKILREDMQISDNAPDWVKEFHELPRQERIESIKSRKKRIEKLIPKIVKFFKEKFGDSLIKIQVSEKPTHYGNENYTIEKILLSFYFDESTKMSMTKREIQKDLSSFFNLDLEYYGMPLDLEFYKQTWTKS